MTKSVWLAFLPASLFLCAFDWPPEPYEMPRTVLTPDILFDCFAGLIQSIKAVANVGLFALGILLCVLVILPKIKRLIFDVRLDKGVKNNEFRRAVKAADRAKNLDAIVDDRVAEMEISGLARKKFRQLHPDADLEERIYQRELSWSAEQAFRQNHLEFSERSKRRRRR